MSGALIGPTITLGVSEHHMTFPGSITLRPSTYIAVMSDYILSLVDHGFERFYVLNGHGGNTATLNAAFAEIYNHLRRARGTGAPDIRCKAAKWFENEICEEKRSNSLGTQQGDTHPAPKFQLPSSPTRPISAP